MAVAAQIGEGAPAGSERLARAAAITLAVLAGLLFAYLVLLTLRPADESSTLIDGWMIVAIELVASGLCVARGVGRGRRDGSRSSSAPRSSLGRPATSCSRSSRSVVPRRRRPRSPTPSTSPSSRSPTSGSCSSYAGRSAS
jgi:hypothetical protein